MDPCQAINNTLLFVPSCVLIALAIDWLIGNYNFLPGVIYYFILGCIASLIVNYLCDRLITWQLDRNYERSKKEDPAPANDT